MTIDKAVIAVQIRFIMFLAASLRDVQKSYICAQLSKNDSGHSGCSLLRENRPPLCLCARDANPRHTGNAFLRREVVVTQLTGHQFLAGRFGKEAKHLPCR